MEKTASNKERQYLETYVPEDVPMPSKMEDGYIWKIEYSGWEYDGIILIKKTASGWVSVASDDGLSFTHWDPDIWLVFDSSSIDHTSWALFGSKPEELKIRHLPYKTSADPRFEAELKDMSSGSAEEKEVEQEAREAFA